MPSSTLPVIVTWFPAVLDDATWNCCVRNCCTEGSKAIGLTFAISMTRTPNVKLEDGIWNSLGGITEAQQSCAVRDPTLSLATQLLEEGVS
jgi:hypothetical protein